MAFKFDLGMKGLAILGCVWFALAAPEQAVAQGCPAGIPSGGNPNCIPPDVYNGNSGGATHSDGGPPLLETWQAGHSAIAFHADSTQVWAAWNMIYLKDAEDKVLSACNQVMGGGCQLGLSSIGGTMAIGRGSNGYIRAAWGNKKKDAIKLFNEGCAKERVDCIVDNTITSTHIKRPVMVMITVRQMAELPETPGFARFGAVASPKQDPYGTKWQGHAWLVTGEPTFASATDKALARCRAATGMDCGLDTHGVNSNLYLYTTKDDYFFWSTGLSRKQAEAGLAKKCKAQHKGKKCAITAFYDTQTPRDEVVMLAYNP